MLGLIKDRYARKYNSHVHRLEIAALKAFEPYLFGTVYDLGCGDKPYKEHLNDLDCDYVGVDWPNSIHSKTADIACDLNEVFPIDSRVANTVLSTSVMEHLCEPQSFLHESFRILKEGGYILIQVPFQWHVHEEPHDYFRFTKYGLEYMLKKAGFIDVRIEAQSGFWVSWILKLNYALSKVLRSKAFYPLWAADQAIARFLDGLSKDESETLGYIAVARKDHGKQGS